MINSLNITKLYNKCNTKLFSFKTTDELEPLKQPLGQDSALETIEFGTDIKQDGYNLFAMGISGSKKHSSIIKFLHNKAKNIQTPSDWCYVNNFKNHQKPIAVQLPAGDANKFKNDIDEMLSLLKNVLPSAFESNSYRNERESINQKYGYLQSDIFKYLQEEAVKHDVSMNATSNTHVTFVPVVNGKVLSAEEFKAIDGKKKEKIMQKMERFEKIVKDELHKVTQLNKEMQKDFIDLDKKTTEQSVDYIIDELRSEYKENEKIVNYLDDMQDDIIKNVENFLTKPENMGIPPFMQKFYTPSFTPYKVNIFISHDKDSNAPVIYEDNPLHHNLIGKIEHLSQVGTLVTDFSMIKSGALHKANGGYLILDARKILTNPFSYEGLKRVLHSKEIRIESAAEHYSLISTTSLEPEPIPLDIKVILIGERILYYLLYHYDPEFKELFKVSVDFEDEMPRNDESTQLYARMIGTISKDNSLLPLTKDAVAKVIEQSSRNISHSLKLSTHLHTLSDLLKEADYYAKKQNRDAVKRDDIEKALFYQTERKNRLQRKLYEQIDDGTIMIDLEKSKIGQINALSYITIGGHHFGLPSRITATTRIGKGEIIDIERKVELGGPLHSKGVMILASYLGAKYAKNIPLSLSASLVFEQSYAMIDGDSASSTELYALLSSICEIPIKQNFAVTGSVNQFGEIQPIGGVNEKIEGFFDICKRKDANAFHAVLIPHQNIKHLMLKQEILDAVKEKKFAVYAVKTIDEGLSILCGEDADQINKKVVQTLERMSKTLKKFYKKDEKKV